MCVTIHYVLGEKSACGHCAEKPCAEIQSAECHSTEKPQCIMVNVPIVLSSRVTEWHDVTTRNNQLNKQLKDKFDIIRCIMKLQYYFDRIITNYYSE